MVDEKTAIRWFSDISPELKKVIGSVNEN